jgi:hypothetical protein
MRGIRQHQFERAITEDVPNWFPVNSGCLHGDMGTPLLSQPREQIQQAGGRGLEAPDLPDNFAPRGKATHATTLSL